MKKMQILRSYIFVILVYVVRKYYKIVIFFTESIHYFLYERVDHILIKMFFSIYM